MKASLLVLLLCVRAHVRREEHLWGPVGDEDKWPPVQEARLPDTQNRWPVILVPGIAGSTLIARYKNCTLPTCTYGTPYSSDWFRLWISLTNFRPPRRHQQCWFDTMTLAYHPPGEQNEGLLAKANVSNGWWTSASGVEVTVETGLKAVGYLDYIESFGFPPTRYFRDIIDSLVDKKMGYVEPFSLRAFPYDWRLPVWQYDWDSFRQMVEDMHSDNGRPVVLVLHSMGMIAINYFLHGYVDEAWKTKHIKAIIAINAASGGSMKAVRSLLSGYNPTEVSWLKYLNLPQLMSNSDMRSLSNTLGSLFMLTPHELLHAPGFDLLSVVSANATKEYTFGDWPSLIPSAVAVDELKVVRSAIRDIAMMDPGVPVYCLFSRSTIPNTEAHYIYSDRSFNDTPDMSYVQGDGTLSRRSLKLCTRWKSTLLVKEFLDLDHMFVLRDPEVVKFVSGIIASLD